MYIYIYMCVNDYVCIYKCDQTGPSSHKDFLSAGTPEFVSLNCHLIASVTVPCSVPEKNAHSSGGGIMFDPFWPRCEY